MPEIRPLPTKAPPGQQNGNILFICAALLAALSILGLSSMRTSLTEERISQSVQDLNIASEAAESALRHGQRQLKTAYQKSLQSGFYKTHTLGAIAPDLSQWENGIYRMSLQDMTVDRSSLALNNDSKVQAWLPRYRLEEFFVPDNELDTGSSISREEKAPRSTSYFRVIARGVGLQGENEILLESIVIEQTR